MSLAFDSLQDLRTTLLETDDSEKVFDLPNEIQRPIFEYAARMDGRCAFNLAQVAQYVHAWTQPILYERVVVRNPHAASCLFRTLSVTLPQAKPLLSELSRRLIVFSLFRIRDFASPFLKFIKSPHLRRITLVCRCGDSSSRPSYAAPYQIPQFLLSSLTHITIVIDYRHGYWNELMSASLVTSTNIPSSSNVAAYSAFQNLTHFAISTPILNDIIQIRTVAKNLRYFVILEPCNFSQSEHSKILRKIRSWEYQGHSTLVLKDLGSPELWSIDDSFRPSNFWKEVEGLVKEGYISDQEERWQL
ncbi:hypothetical protein GALMADRAFT_248885 [Galerina marginata CBS 339.88]|uniref:F-box domain-containing protein n=1 Tax=Galerina marginata (strain CBS 339.88) TaxID=685588 RepID=A0A067T7S4_GALM3|nr:hypothetical protein GALMADRAFT_248885 [Galerina marginata CBS 339.88]